MISNKHSGDCTIYASLVNGMPYDGICTCGVGFERIREGSHDDMFSEEREEHEDRYTKLLAIAEEMAKNINESGRHGICLSGLTAFHEFKKECK